LHNFTFSGAEFQITLLDLHAESELLMLSADADGTKASADALIFLSLERALNIHWHKYFHGSVFKCMYY
jgi:hypothetical protein